MRTDSQPRPRAPRGYPHLVLQLHPKPPCPRPALVSASVARGKACEAFQSRALGERPARAEGHCGSLRTPGCLHLGTGHRAEAGRAFQLPRRGRQSPPRSIRQSSAHSAVGAAGMVLSRSRAAVGGSADPVRTGSTTAETGCREPGDQRRASCRRAGCRLIHLHRCGRWPTGRGFGGGGVSEGITRRSGGPSPCSWSPVRDTPSAPDPGHGRGRGTAGGRPR